jgi:glycosyltransferase involved in cell wall biosynthesis
MKPRISVLVPTYNRAQFLPQCLAGLFAQTLEPFEIIVVDDGSTDGTADLLRGYGERLQVIRQPNGGKSTALNLGLERVQGDFVWTFDDDDVALPHALERMVAPLAANPDLGMTFAGYIKAQSLPDGTLDGHGIEKEVPAFPDADLFLTLLRKGNLLETSAAILVRTAVYRRVGPFDTRLIRSQDYDMVLRLSHSCAAARVPGPMFIFRQHEGLRGSARDRFTAEQKLAKWRVYDKIIIGKIRQETPLQDYLAQESRSAYPSPVLLRQAYLQRSGVMANAGLFAEMLDDLRSAFKIDGERQLTDEERALWEEMDHHRFLEDEKIMDRRFICELREVCKQRAGRQISILLAQRLYWHARASMAGRRRRSAVRALRSAWGLLGMREMIRTVCSRIARRPHVPAQQLPNQP